MKTCPQCHTKNPDTEDVCLNCPTVLNIEPDDEQTLSLLLTEKEEIIPVLQNYLRNKLEWWLSYEVVDTRLSFVHGSTRKYVKAVAQNLGYEIELDSICFRLSKT